MPSKLNNETFDTEALDWLTNVMKAGCEYHLRYMDGLDEPYFAIYWDTAQHRWHYASGMFLREAIERAAARHTKPDKEVAA